MKKYLVASVILMITFVALTSSMGVAANESVPEVGVAAFAGGDKVQDIAFGEHTLNGLYGLTIQGSFLVPNPETEQMDPILFNMLGQITADGQGNIIEGFRTLNFTSSGGGIQEDTLTGAYTVNADGAGSIVLNAFQGDEQVAVEELDCYFMHSGQGFECILTRVATGGADPAEEVPVVAVATGVRQQAPMESQAQLDAAETRAANEQLATRLLDEVWHQGNIERVDELLSEDFVSYAFPEGGREAMKAAVADFREEMPEGYFVVDEMITTEDKVVMRGSLAASKPAEGEEPERLDHWITIFTIKDGQIADRWVAIVPPGE